MDNFIDKLAQKFTSGEVIRANQAAEERELKRLREQVSEYEKCLQEMRKLQMCNTQTAEALKQLMQKTGEDMDKLTGASLKKIEQVTALQSNDEIRESLDRLVKSLEENQKEVEAWFRQADDFLHKENVKVYRNVQAVVVDEAKAGKEAILKAQEETAGKYYKKAMWMMVLTFLAAAAGVTIQVMNLLGLL